ncbi:MAG: hypothetical protein R2911_44480 [Caldilineaceae bacterium]
MTMTFDPAVQERVALDLAPEETESCVQVASQWQLMWRKFRSTKEPWPGVITILIY